MRFHNIPIRNIMQEAVRYGGVIVDVRTEEEFLKRTYTNGGQRSIIRYTERKSQSAKK